MKLFYSDTFELPLPAAHKFPMAKYRLLRERIQRSTEFDDCELLAPPPATPEQLLRVHTPEYLRRVFTGELSPLEQRRIGFPWSPEMVVRSRHSVGASIAAAAAALGDGISVNLAGGTHHAFADAGQGYCVFNDVCVAARELQQTAGIRQIMVIDLDVHQGNGTAAICADDPTLFTVSIHCNENYPYRKTASDLDVGLPAGTADAEYLAALNDALTRALEQCQPEFVFYLSGADPYADDRFGRLQLSKSALAARDQRVIQTFGERRIPMAIAMAGGYAPVIDDIVDIHFRTVAIAADQIRRRQDRTALVASPDPRA